MDPQRQREIASKGGKAAHAKGTAHEFDSEEARRAGRKGGEVVSRNREHMAEIGRRGGEARGENRAAMRGSSRSEESEERGEARGGERVSRDTMGRSGVERERQTGDGSPGIDRGAGLGGRELGERDRLSSDRQERDQISRGNETR